jgi:WD40 repeat protein
MPNVFISYAREDQAFVRRLHQALTEWAPPKDVWVDLEDIPPAAAWRREIMEAIDAAESFVFVISPEALASPVCRQELERATLGSKRCIPILGRKPEDERAIPDILRERNWVDFRDDFVRACALLVEAVDTDLEWVRAHTWLHDRTMNWQSRNRADTALLRGVELQEALKWEAVASTGKQPPLNALHHDFVRTSQLWEAGEIERWKNLYAVASSRQIAVQAEIAQGPLPPLLAVESFRTRDIFESRRALWSVGERYAQVRHYLEGHTGSVLGLAFDPAGETLASASWDLSIGLWDLRTRRPVRDRLLGHRGPVAALVFNPRSGALVSAGYDNTLLSWDLATGRSRTLAEADEPMLCLAFSPNGELLAAGSQAGFVFLLHADTGRPIARGVRGHSAALSGVSFAPSGKEIVSASVAGEIAFWDLAARPLQFSGFRADDGVTSLAVSSRGVIAWGERSGSVIVLDRGEENPRPTRLFRHGGQVSGLAFSPSGRLLASAGSDRHVIVWDFERQGARFDLQGHAEAVLCVAFSPDERTLASGGWDKAIAIRETEPRRPQALRGSRSPITSLAFASDGRALACASLMGGGTLWDLASLEARATIAGTAVAGGSAARYFALRTPEGSVEVRRFESAEPVGEPYTLEGAKIDWFALSAEGARLVCASGGTAQTFDVGSGTPKARRALHAAGNITALALSADGALLVSGSDDGRIRRWNAETLDPIGEDLLGHAAPVITLATTPDGSLLASGDTDDTIRLWTLSDGSSQRLAGHLRVDTKQHHGQATLGGLMAGLGRQITGLSFAPDGRMLASVGGGGNVLLWDTRTGRGLLAAPLQGHKFGAHCVAFAPDGQTLASGGGDEVLLWTVGPQAIAARMEPIANRNLTHDEWRLFVGDEPYRLTAPALQEPGT